MKRFSSIVSMFFVFALVGLMFADSASAAGRGRRGRTSCDCGPSCAAEPGCAAEPACGAAACAAEPACGAAEPACGADSGCCESRRRGRVRGARRSKGCGESCTSCCAEPACGAEPCCNAG
ncbi:MAG: hypothetical protein ACKOYJ_00275 [Planctomycetia bacterium]